MHTSKDLRREEPLSIPGISDQIFCKENDLKDMIWFIAGALRQASPQPLTVQQIRSSIEEHQPWRIDECRGTNKRLSAERNIRWILSCSPAFESVAGSPGYWRMTGNHLVRTSNLLPPLPVAPMSRMTEEEIRACL
ncbi:glycoside hydrolase family 5 protein [Tulasnella calospora MUT 4182]|uniref:Glycoside hydrolase family 5 protein n=1 Tax=Tulasnella calospora MUT 4182 TaxID=1051891 RepID=A0A0C3QGN8_9AGAM|nr:glycoside hydrolase family 5 protein [Tulasnella calospora MUT 4182]